MLLVTLLAIDGALTAGVDFLQSSKVPRGLPVKTVVQVLKLVLYSVATIAVISLIIGQSPTLLLGGLGAMTAVLMLIFKDPILGLLPASSFPRIRWWLGVTGLRCRSTAPMATCWRSH